MGGSRVSVVRVAPSGAIVPTLLEGAGDLIPTREAEVLIEAFSPLPIAWIPFSRTLISVPESRVFATSAASRTANVPSSALTETNSDEPYSVEVKVRLVELSSSPTS